MLGGSSNFNGYQIYMAKDHQAMTVQNMPLFNQNAKSVEGYTKQNISSVRCNFYGGMGHIENKCWKKNPKNGTIVTKYLKALIDDKKATLTKLNRIYVFIYDVFSHVRVPKRKIPMNVLVDVVPNSKTENLGVGMMLLT
jgi:hypothetical protein